MQVEKLYSEILEAAITEIQTARVSIARKVNQAGIGMYWNLGKLLSEKKIEKGHGAGVVKRLSVDLKSRFPDIGASPRNLWDMKRFYEHYKDASPKLRRSVAVLPWRHNLLLIEKVTNDKEALYYAEKAIHPGWTRDILLNYIKVDAFNNEKHLPKSQNFSWVKVSDLLNWKLAPADIPISKSLIEEFDRSKKA